VKSSAITARQPSVPKRIDMRELKVKSSKLKVRERPAVPCAIFDN
jgi:hypothetical protein